MANKIQAYEMEMVFSASVGLKKINSILDNIAFAEKLQVQDALSISLKQTLPFVPDDNYIQQIAGVIKDNYETDEINITQIRFVGYKYLRQISVEEA